MEGQRTIALRKLSEDLFKDYYNFVCIEDFANVIRFYHNQIRFNNYAFTQANSLMNTRLKVICDQAGFKNYIQIADDLSQLLSHYNDYASCVKQVELYFHEKNMMIPNSKYVHSKVQYALEDLFEKQNEYPSSLDYIHTLIDQCDNPELNNNESYRLRVLKLLIVECQYKIRDLANKIQEIYKDTEEKIKKKDLIRYILDRVNETIFDDKRFSELEIIQCANDIAQAKFTRAGGVRKNIYILAYALKMKYYLNEEKNDPVHYDPQKDVEKQLFDNFYGIEDLNEVVALGGEQNTSAAGANYKNFMELCYLHGLRKRYSFNDVQIMINNCSKISRDNEVLNNDLLAVTKDYRDSYLDYLKNEQTKMDEFVKEMSKTKRVTDKMYENAEKDFFIEYVTKNYDCKRKEIAVAQEQISAYQVYKEMIDEILEDREIDIEQIDIVSSKIIELIKTKVEMNKDDTLIVFAGKEKKKDVKNRINDMIKNQELSSQLIDYIASINWNLYQLLSIEEIVKETINEELINDIKNIRYSNILDMMTTNASDEHPCLKLEELLNDEELFNKDANSISRYVLMIVFMYWWDLTLRSGDVTFIEYKNAVIAELNDKLIRSRYQPFDNKNFFDTVIVLMLFYSIKESNNQFN